MCFKVGLYGVRACTCSQVDDFKSDKKMELQSFSQTIPSRSLVKYDLFFCKQSHAAAIS